MLDTSVVIHLIEGDSSILMQVAQLSPDPVISAFTRVELEAGVIRLPDQKAERRQRLDEILKTLDVLDFSNDAAAQYGVIITETGFSRRQIFDRMIGAHAIAANLTLVSMNGADFQGIPGLSLLAW